MLNFDNHILNAENDKKFYDLDQEKLALIDNAINIFVNLSWSDNK